MKKIAAWLAVALVWVAQAAAEPVEQLLSEGRVDQAIEQLQNRIGTAPNDAAAQNLLCRAYFAVGNWNQGASACEKAVALAAGNSDYHLWLGRVYGEKADHTSFWSAAGLAKKVRTEFETAVQLDPGNIDARTDLAEFYLEAPGIVGGGKDKAEAQAQKLAPLDAVKAHWVRGRIAEKKKDLTTAENEYRAGILASNGRADAWLNLALFYRHVERTEAMQDAIRHASLAEAGQSYVLVDAADTLLRTNRDLPAATEMLRRYLSHPTMEAAPAFRAHYLLGQALERQGSRQAAAVEYRTALSLAKSFEPARDALERLSNQVAEKIP